MRSPMNDSAISAGPMPSRVPTTKSTQADAARPGRQVDQGEGRDRHRRNATTASRPRLRSRRGRGPARAQQAIAAPPARAGRRSQNMTRPLATAPAPHRAMPSHGPNTAAVARIRTFSGKTTRPRARTPATRPAIAQGSPRTAFRTARTCRPSRVPRAACSATPARCRARPGRRRARPAAAAGAPADDAPNRAGLSGRGGSASASMTSDRPIVRFAVVDRPQAVAVDAELVRGTHQRASAPGAATSLGRHAAMLAQQAVADLEDGRALASLRASIARSHSVSAPIERLFMLAEPTRSKRSSTTMTLEWIMVSVVCRPARPRDRPGARDRRRPRAMRRQKRMRPLRMVCRSTRNRGCAAPRSPPRARAAAQALGQPSAISGELRNWFSM